MTGKTSVVEREEDYKPVDPLHTSGSTVPTEKDGSIDVMDTGVVEGAEASEDLEVGENPAVAEDPVDDILSRIEAELPPDYQVEYISNKEYIFTKEWHFTLKTVVTPF